MRGRSSIFSFDTLQGLPRASASVKWCVGLLLAFRLLISWVAPDPTARYDILNAAEYLHSVQHGDLRVVFFGSSRMQSAVLAEEWARRAGLRKDQVVNLAVNDGRFWDALYMVDASGGVPPSVDLVIIEIAHWEFNRNVLSPIGGMPEPVPQHFRHVARLSERLAADGMTLRMGLLADLMWPLYVRQPLERWQYRAQSPKPAAPPPPIHHWDKDRENNLAQAAAFKGANIVKLHFFRPEMSKFATWNLDRLLSQLRNDSRRIVLVELPARREYLHAIQEDPAKVAFYRDVQGVVRAHASGLVSSVIWEGAADCGLTEDVFVDYGHFSREGAHAFTDRFFDELVARQIVAKPG
jgi:hypothetical protein